MSTAAVREKRTESRSQERKSRSKKTHSAREWIKINTRGVHYKDLNREIRALAEGGARKCDLEKV